jgi:hypothetical protein
MNKLRDALVAARTAIAAQQSRMSQMTNDLVRAKQSRISNDLTGLFNIIYSSPTKTFLLFLIEVHVLVDSIRQKYETEINDLKHILQLFDNTDSNEHMAEILRLRKKLDELITNKVHFNYFYFGRNILYFSHHRQLPHQLQNSPMM